MRLAGADVFADQMRFGHRHVEFRRFVTGIGRRILNHQTFGFGVRRRKRGAVGTAGSRQGFQAEKTADAVLEVDDEVTFLQFGEINVEGGADGERLRRFQPARALDFIAAKNLRVGDHDKFGILANETAGKRTNSRPGSGVRRLGIYREGILFRTRDPGADAPFRPNFVESLPFTVVVAKDVDGIVLPQPAVKLMEKFAALRLGNWQFGCAFGQRTVGIE